MTTLENLTVQDAFQLDGENPIILKVTDEFSLVINDFAHHVDLRGIFVVDEDSRFVGVITRTDLLDWARAKLGMIIQKPLTEIDKTLRLITLIRASKVGDILRPETKNATVRRHDTLDHAIRIMIDSDLIVLPVVDESQQVIGRLRLSELLDLALT